MALPTQVVQIPIVGGLAEHIEARVVEPGAFLSIENYVYDKAGALRKRSGFGLLPVLTTDGGTLPDIDKLDASAAGELLAVGTDPGDDDSMPRLYSYSPALEQWNNRDNVCPASLTRRPALRTQHTLRGGCVAVCAGKRFVSYALQGLGIYLKVFEVATGAVLYDDTIAVVSKIQHTLFTIDDKVLLVWNDGDEMKVIKIDGATMSQGSATVVCASSLGGNIDEWDACVVDADRFAIAFTATAHVTDGEVYVIDLATLVSLANDAIVDTDIAKIGISATDTRVAVAWANDDGADYTVKAQALAAADLSTITAQLSVETTVPDVSHVVVHIGPVGDTYVAWDGEDPTTEDGVFARGIDASWALLGAGKRTLFHTAIWSRPWSSGGQVYLLVANALTGAPPHPQGGVLVCLSDVTTTTKPLTTCGIWGTVDSYESGAPTKPTVTVVSTALGDVFEAPTLVYSEVLPIPLAGLDVLRIDFRPSQPALWTSAQANGLLLQAGGFTGSYDGQSVVELGFMHAPYVVPLAPVPFVGGINDVGDYQYVAIYAWRDGRGNLHLSGVSAIATSTLVLADIPAKVDVEVETISATRRGDSDDGAGRNVEIWLYRTEADGSTFYRVGVASENTRTTHTKTISDTTSDLTLMASAVPLYTAGGVLESQAPPPSVALCAHRGRLWLASGEDERSVWFSQLLLQGEAPRFNAELSVRLDDAPDAVTALAPLGLILVAFTATRIYRVDGDGPNDTGEGGAFTVSLVTSTLGCVDARSVVAFEGGILFQSARGFCLLDMNGAVSYVGAPVEDTLATYPTVSAGSLDVARSRIAYLATGYFEEEVIPGGLEVVTIPAGYRSKFLVFDYLHGGAWLTWAINDSLEQYAATLWRGANVYSDPGGVCLEAYGSYPGLDPVGDAPVSVLETPWIKASALDGYQLTRHVIINGKQDGYNVVTVELMNDYSDTVLQTTVFDATAAPDILGLPVQRLDVHVANQKASAIKIRITDEYTGGLTSQERLGMSIAALALEIGTKTGRAKLPTANRK